MKIAFVVHDYRRREGHSRYVVELATRYAESHEVHVFANHIEAESDSKIHFHHVPAWRRSALISILSFAVQATFCVRGRFDIIHNQGLCGWRGNVYTAHICNRAWHRALRRVAGRLKPKEWISGSALGALEYLFYRWTRNCQVIAVSGRIAEDLRKFYRARPPISVVYHGVDADSFRPARKNPLRGEVRSECGLNEDDMAFLFVGDLRKGARQCLEALAKLPSGKLLFVSRSDAEPYRQLAVELGLRERALFMGPTGHVERYYAASDAFVLPSHYDSFALVVAEAMASELPVIVSTQAGASELIRDSVNGLLIEDFQDSGELASKMRSLIDDRAFAARLAAEGRRTAEQRSWDVTARETMKVYERQMRGENAARCVEKSVRVRGDQRGAHWSAPSKGIPPNRRS